MAVVAVALLTTTVAACGGEPQTSPTANLSTAGATRDQITTPVAPRPADQPCAGRPGQEIAAVEIPAVHTEPVRVADQQLDGHDVPGFVVPGIDIPAQHVPAQCALTESAPAGCFGAVTIPATSIPAGSIPAATIPGVNVPGTSQGPIHQDAVTQGAFNQTTVTTGRVCAQKVRPGEFRPSVFQSSTFRPSVLRPAMFRSALFRPAVCLNGKCIPAVSVPAGSVPAVNVPAVNVPARNLSARVLPEVTSKCVHVLGGRGTAAYDVCADVLFAFNRADLRPRATSVLRQVARSLAKRYPDRAVHIDGHTDSTGSPAYNQRLSLRRAAAVKRWLVAHGQISADRIAVRGYGETRPVDSNAAASGRAQPSRRDRRRMMTRGMRFGTVVVLSIASCAVTRSAEADCAIDTVENRVYRGS